jgi:exonuclease III
VSSEKQLKKIAALMTLNTGIIFLSDVRLNADPESKKSNLFKNCGNMAYDFLHNSSKSKRGVGILISAKLGFVVQKNYRDPDNNVLGLVIESNGEKLLLISVYGPNNNNMEFFEFLTGILDENRSTPVICGGDWNLTYSTDPTVNNIDIINMASPPSVIRSKRLSDLCADFHLIDPYRALHPSRREYTYVPRARTANRSYRFFFNK